MARPARETRPLGEGDGGGRLLRPPGLDDGELVAARALQTGRLRVSSRSRTVTACKQHIADGCPKLSCNP